jgi:hypothetical protein
MGCENCSGACEDEKKVSLPNLVINITYNDQRVHEDQCNYVENVDLRDSEE